MFRFTKRALRLLTERRDKTPRWLLIGIRSPEKWHDVRTLQLPPHVHHLPESLCIDQTVETLDHHWPTFPATFPRIRDETEPVPIVSNIRSMPQKNTNPSRSPGRTSFASMLVPCNKS